MFPGGGYRRYYRYFKEGGRLFGMAAAREKMKWYARSCELEKPVDRKFLRSHYAFRRCFGIEVVFASLSLPLLMAGPAAR